MHTRDEPERRQRLAQPARRTDGSTGNARTAEADSHPAELSPNVLPALQRTVGNAAVTGMPRVP
ncbi:hypothetical protein ACQPZF_18150 [Actinosynnema sp. CS-041913]|uniref:hypothetical protein n=1 Tax=Actinosynnema sp. CS-041913 TaxID=3239917 RepID=UPI003D94BC97